MISLKQLLESKTNISESDWEYIQSHLNETSFSKKEIVTKQGQIESKIYFVLEGIFRIYMELPEKDVTIDFAFPGDLISSYTSFLTQRPSDSAIQSLTSSKVLYITHSDLQNIYQHTTSGESIGRVFAEEFFQYKSKRELSFLKDSPTQRYLALFDEQPELIREIPQVYLSSYIGITPQALSRIRAKIFDT